MKIRKYSIAWFARECWIFVLAAAVIAAAMGVAFAASMDSPGTDAPDAASDKAAQLANEDDGSKAYQKEKTALKRKMALNEMGGDLNEAVASEAETEEPAVEPEKFQQNVGKTSEKTYMGEFVVTAYCSCEKCCGQWAANRPGGVVYTASGAEATDGVTVGASWDLLPTGTVIEIEGLGQRTVQDKPADWIVDRYDGKIIDVYFADHDAAVAYGKKTADVWKVAEGHD